jgi:hypothetical protein
LRIEPAPAPEEAAAIMAALEALREDEDRDSLNRDPLSRSGWHLAGLLGHVVPASTKLEGSLWSCSSREGMT